MEHNKQGKKESIEIIDKPTYRAKEAAAYLSIGVSTLWLWAKSGKLHPIKIGDRVTVFKKEDLDKLIAGV